MYDREQTRRAMTEASVIPLILRMALPNAVGLLVISAYSLADSFFVSSLGTEASAAVGLTFSLHVLMQAVGYTLGMGAGSLISRALGGGDTQNANRYAVAAHTASVTLGILISLVGLLFRVPILRLLGASDTLLETALDYVTPLFLTAPAMCASFTLSQLLRAEGRATRAMVGLAVGSLLNIALDPLLISVFSLGITGASVATLISQYVGYAILLSAYLTPSSPLRLFGKGMLSALPTLGAILAAGLPSLFRQGLSGVAVILLNRAATAAGGESAVAAISLVSRIFLLVFSLCLGVGQGMMPVVGYSHGAERWGRMKKAYLFSVAFASAIMLLVSLPLFFFAPTVIGFFRNDAAVISVGAFALRAQSAVLFTHGAVTCTILFLQATGHPYLGTVLASARQGIFFFPLLLLLPQAGLLGVSLLQPVADGLTLLFSIPFSVYAMRLIKRKK